MATHSQHDPDAREAAAPASPGAVDYRSSGVDIDAGNEVVRRIRRLARGTATPGVLSEIGSFGGLFSLDPARPDATVLVASADGVGTKLKVAFLTGRHDTIGEDLVNHCTNDILVQGARPLFFLDYLATGRLDPDVAVAVVEGLARACRANGCALLGGETAEMPGFYADGEYDLAGFIVGSVAREAIIDGRSIAPGDVLVALPSSGLHTNGYSLARRIAFDVLGLDVASHVEPLGTSVGEALLVPHRSYLPAVEPLLAARVFKGLAHITGGGITENLPRILPPATAAVIDRASWEIPPVFAWLVEAGRLPADEAFRAFNMGVGMIGVVAPESLERTLAGLAAAGEPGAWVVGRVT
ncbi:MAG: phosphoribosylformylglycinamidine cyclo-ligase, partial [Vicinamibacteraceae bacterium]|nr:phosphoribosylformylglycinamidine cyclo-ligase [Vicinamibacteraceae bacterium]